MGDFLTTGERLREERKRLGVTQADFAKAGGIGVSSLKLYEGDDGEPGAIFLGKIANIGADIQYVVTGVRSATTLAADEQVLLDGYRALDPATRRRMLAFMLTESGPVAVQKKIKEAVSVADKYRGAKIGGVSEGDFTGTAHIQVGGKSKK